MGLLGCETPPPAVAPPEPPLAETTQDGRDAKATVGVLGVDYAQWLVRQEAMLHAALYRAAFESRVHAGARYFILDPVQEDDPPDLGVEPAEFRARVLTHLADLNVPLAWAPSTWRTQVEDVFPGTNEPATRLQIRILQRIEDQATVIAEVSDRTANVGASRQGVTAIWDGLAWQIERDRARVVW